ncbi:MAG: hypothetical protein WAM91_16460 [Candidatus Acidiferrales bacterium]
MTRPDGQTVEGRPVNTSGFHGLGGNIVLPPGADFKHQLLLNLWFDFKSDGTYVITSRLARGIKLPNGDQLEPTSEVSRLLVRPRDPKRLEVVCRDILRQLEAWPNVEDEQTMEPPPGQKLSYVDDPVAVPYLEQALHAHKVLTDEYAVAGLEKIGNDEAVQALLSGLRDTYGDIARLSRFALVNLENRVTDPALKQKISRALRAPGSN